MVVVALLSVDLVESVDLVSVELVVNCICWARSIGEHTAWWLGQLASRVTTTVDG